MRSLVRSLLLPQALSQRGAVCKAASQVFLVMPFPFLKEIKEFDFSFQPSLDKAKIMDLMTLRFIENAENVIFCGTPGVGKTNLAVSIGIEAAKHRYCVYFITFQDLISQLKKASSENRLEARIKWFCRYKLLIIDELGYQKMDVDSANLFFNFRNGFST